MIVVVQIRAADAGGADGDLDLIPSGWGDRTGFL